MFPNQSNSVRRYVEYDDLAESAKELIDMYVSGKMPKWAQSVNISSEHNSKVWASLMKIVPSEKPFMSEQVYFVNTVDGTVRLQDADGKYTYFTISKENLLLWHHLRINTRSR